MKTSYILVIGWFALYITFLFTGAPGYLANKALWEATTGVWFTIIGVALFVATLEASIVTSGKRTEES